MNFSNGLQDRALNSATNDTRSKKLEEKSLLTHQ